MTIENATPAVLLGLFVLILCLERFSPWTIGRSSVRQRWLTNVGLYLLGGVLLVQLFPASVPQVAAELYNGRLQSLQLPLLLEAALLALILDCWRYWEHRVFHELPLLWRVHLVHHSDPELDSTTSQRHHPIEAVLVTLSSLLLLFVLGFSASALALYILAAAALSLLVHASVRLPDKLDRALRLVFVTPAVHAFHHSALQPQTDSNYGTLFTFWDRLFGTYTDPDAATIPEYGLSYFYRPADGALGPVLLQPFEYRRDMAYP